MGEPELRYVEVGSTSTSTGEVVTVTLARPERRNVLAFEVIRELDAVLDAIGHSPAVGVVLAAQGPVFSAGHDFADMVGTSIDDARHLLQACTHMMDTVQLIPQVVIARVHALATAAGCQLVASCDLAVAAESAAFALPGGRGGLFCHTPLVAVARQIGRKRALEMAMTGDPISAATAAEWGLVNRVVPDAELDAAVTDLMLRATRGSAMSKGVGKRTFYAQVGMEQPAAYEMAIEVMAEGATSPDAQEGMRSFVEKRLATFTQPPTPPSR